MHLDIRLMYPHTQSQFTTIDTNLKKATIYFWR